MVAASHGAGRSGANDEEDNYSLRFDTDNRGDTGYNEDDFIEGEGWQIQQGEGINPGLTPRHSFRTGYWNAFTGYYQDYRHRRPA